VLLKIFIQPKILLFLQQFFNLIKKINWPLAMINCFKTDSEDIKENNFSYQ